MAFYCLDDLTEYVRESKHFSSRLLPVFNQNCMHPYLTPWRIHILWNSECLNLQLLCCVAVSEILASFAQCWIPLIVPDRRCWAAVTEFQPLENTDYEESRFPPFSLLLPAFCFPVGLASVGDHPGWKWEWAGCDRLPPEVRRNNCIKFPFKIRNRSQTWQSCQLLLLGDTICLHKWDSVEMSR